MEHFSEQVWSDFVRGMGDSAECAGVELHIAAGCTECAATLNLLQRVNTIASDESRYRPPEDVVRMTKLEFVAGREQVEQAIEGNLRFDSFLQPALAGVRSVVAAPRQMVYETDSLTVDLRFERPPSSSKIYLTGQVVDKCMPRISMGNAQVMLWTEQGLPVAETSTTGFGEFAMDFEEQDRLRLSIQVPGKKIVRIRLADLRPKWDATSNQGGTDAGNQ